MRVTDGDNIYEAFQVVSNNIPAFQEWLENNFHPTIPENNNAYNILRHAIGHIGSWKVQQLYPLCVVAIDSDKMHIHVGGFPDKYIVI